MSMGVKSNLSMGALSEKSKRLPFLQLAHKSHLQVSKTSLPLYNISPAVKNGVLKQIQVAVYKVRAYVNHVCKQTMYRNYVL